MQQSVLHVKALVGAFKQEKGLLCGCEIFANLRLKLYSSVRSCNGEVADTTILPLLHFRKFVCLPALASCHEAPTLPTSRFGGGSGQLSI